MATRHDLDSWVREALDVLGGRGTVVAVARIVWQRHEDELKSSGDLFYTWQYDMRWAANRLRRVQVILVLVSILKKYIGVSDNGCTGKDS